jgi:hypothetical protein
MVVEATKMATVNDRIAKYDGNVGALFQDGENVGIVFLEAQSWTFVRGPFYRRRRWNETRLAWRVLFQWQAQSDEGLYEHTELGELDRKIFTYAGVPYDLECLDPEAAQAERRKFEGLDP